MTLAFSEIRELLILRMREYLSEEQNRRDAQSAVASLATFFLCLIIAAGGMMPSYMLIDRPGRAISVHFSATQDVGAAELSQTRLRNPAKQSPKTASLPAAPFSNRPPPLETLSSMASARPDYFGRQAILAPSKMERPGVSDAPAEWRDRPAIQEQRGDRQSFGSSSVAMPSPKIGSPTGKGDDASSDISFDVPVSGGSKGSDFITLSSRSLPSSVGRAGGKEMSVRRQTLKAPLPAVPEWFERKGLDSFVAMRILISANGKVESAEVEKTSGFKELDAEARAAVLQWVFEPTGYRESISIKFNYKLR